MKRSHLMPFGAELRPDGSARFRLWAPKARQVDLCLEDSPEERLALTAVNDGWFELITRRSRAGSRYRFSIDEGAAVPDPASRFQPLDVHGPSEVVDPSAFDWDDDNWRGRPWEQAVIYELHVGAFSRSGTFCGVEEKLDYLRDLDVTAIELMPVADFPGKRNWGYDGVFLFAPDSSYGRPEDLKRLVQAAHARNLMVFLDVVYNHFGPDGNYLRLYSPQFFTDRHHTPWGDAINFEDRVVRDFFIHNALYWLEEYHLDGLRLDAVHTIVDESRPDILIELAQTVRERVGDDRHVHLILENGNNAARYLRRDAHNRPKLYDAQWNDDIHHALHVLLTSESDGYYSDYTSQPIEQLCRCLTEGFAFQGDYSEFHGAKRGEKSSDLPPSAFVLFLQNHDQIGNRAFGERILRLARPQAVKAAMEILLLAPEPPLLFMGEEFGATTPFFFFCDFAGKLAAAVTNGRRNEFARFVKFSAAQTRDQIPDPNAEKTYLESKLDWESVKKESHAGWLQFYRELLSIRQRMIVPLVGEIRSTHVGFCREGTQSFSITWFLGDGTELMLVANLGDEYSTEIPPPEGERFYCSSPEAGQAQDQGGLLPWSVVWSLKKN